jgi:NAD(P)H-dependent FMN reductase
MADSLRILVLSASLNPASKSRGLARAAADSLRSLGATVEWVDLQDLPLPFCDGASSNQDPNALALRSQVEAADGILFAAPVYNFDLNAAAKNVVELTGRAWTGKVVAFAVAAGGQRSGMSPMGLANSLMLDFRCIVLPRYVYACRGDWEEGLPNAECVERVEELSTELLRVAGALA